MPLRIAALLAFCLGASAQNAMFFSSNVTSVGPGGSCGATINGFTHCRKLTIDHTQVSSSLTDFTVVLNTTIANLKSTGNGGSVTDAQGDDIVFTSDSGCTTMINWDPLESWNSSTGAIVAWVKLTLVDQAADTNFYICYGKSSITTFQGGAAGSAWDTNSQGAFHLSDNAANTTIVDATGHSNATSQANTSTKTTSGQIANALNYSASTDYATVSQSGFGAGTRTWSFSAWINPAQIGTVSCIFLNDIAGNLTGFFIDASGKLQGFAGGAFMTGSTTLSAGTWYHVAMDTENGVGTIIYLNGVSDATSASTTLFDSAATQFGGDQFGSNLGKLDETEMATINRASGWYLAEYNNQKTGSTFITVGAES